MCLHSQPPERNSSQSRHRAALLLGLLLLFSTVRATAQVPGYWELSDSLENWNAIDMQFSDPEHGLIVADTISGYIPPTGHQSAAIRTTDAGKTWQLFVADSVGTGKHPLFKRVSVRSFSMPTPRDAYEITNDGFFGHTLATHDGGLHWLDHSTPFVPGVAYIWFRMFPFGTGRGIDVTRGSGVPVAKTFDSARSFSGVGFNDPIDNRITDAVFLDTLNFWVSYADGEMLHSTDGGFNFNSDTIAPGMDTFTVLNSRIRGGVPVVDTAPAFTLGPITSTNDPLHLYALVSRSVREDTVNFPFHSTYTPTYFETQDGGKNWTANASIEGNRIFRLASAGPKKLWAIVGNTPNFYYMYRGNLSGLGCDSLFYSSDDGQTWVKDGTTFHGMSLIEMCWPDETHGYIVAARDSSLLVYRFVSTAGVASRNNSEKPLVGQLLTTAVTNELSLHLNGDGTSLISIIDILGRTVLCENKNGPGNCTLNTSSIPKGVYQVVVTRDGQTSPLGKIVVLAQ